MAAFTAIRLGFGMLLLALVSQLPALASPEKCEAPVDVCEGRFDGAFPLVRNGAPAIVVTSPQDWPGVLRAAQNLRDDLKAVSGSSLEDKVTSRPVILAGTIGQSPEIDQLIAEGALDVSAIEGVWEGYVQAVVEAPTEGMPPMLVIAGADKRGTIFGIYDLSERAGVSPWTWWADVPVPVKPELSVLPGTRADWPRVKYRGIFINDEKPALHGWANKTYGGFNSAFYEKVFELILRHKANYLWPAMWGEAIYDDDPLTGPLADEMGVVLGTSHHEPLGRAHVEWARYGKGKWDYTTNAEALRDFWQAGVERMKDFETIITLGMRGDGDEAMTEGTAINLLENIVGDQREIISKVTGRAPEKQPSLWALYKEVQDYYDQGMKVPDDVTLLFADDNWGNIRRLPEPGASRPGGYGVYYHFDYVGGPRNYKWLNTNQIERIWEQMNLAWEFGARQIWIVNVGDIKPMELPISFFLDHAWNPETMSAERMTGYPEIWADQQFPAEFSKEVGDLLRLYTKYASRRKHELVDPDTFSLVNHDEFRRVTAEWEELAARADIVRAELPEEYDDAFVQLVWFPVHASANLYRLYEAVALNRLYAAQGRARDAIRQADLAEEYYENDAILTRIYHEDVSDGKWDHMMSQTHIGYTYWQQPEEQVMPAVVRPKIPTGRKIGVAGEGRDAPWWPGDESRTLPQSDVFERQTRWIEIYPAGDQAVEVRLAAEEDWLELPVKSLVVSETVRVPIGIDWDAAPMGNGIGRIEVSTAAGEQITISVPTFKPHGWDSIKGYPIAGGFGTMEFAEATRKIDGQGRSWRTISNLGRTGDGVTLLPVTSGPVEPGQVDAPRFEFDIHLFERGDLTINVELAPTLDFKGQGGFRYAVSLDDGPPVPVNINSGTAAGDWNESVWEQLVARNAHQHPTIFDQVEPGPHILKVWAVDAPVVFQKVTVSQRPVPESYLGPLALGSR